MSPVTPIQSSPPPPQAAEGEHGGHNAATGTPAAGSSFANTLAQTISQATPQAGGTAHGTHGVTSAPAGPGNSGTGSAQHSGAHGATDGSGHPGHIPLTGTGHSGKHGLQEAALGLRAYRQQLIASNIANADTPGYKAVDIDFQEALNLALSGSGTKPLSLAATAPGHIPGQGFSASPYPLKYHTPSQASADGNTVEMDVERAKFSENAIMYEYSLDRVKGHFTMTLELLKNLPY